MTKVQLVIRVREAMLEVKARKDLKELRVMMVQEDLTANLAMMVKMEVKESQARQAQLVQMVLLVLMAKRAKMVVETLLPHLLPRLPQCARARCEKIHRVAGPQLGRDQHTTGCRDCASLKEACGG